MCLSVPGKIIGIDNQPYPFFIPAEADLIRMGQVNLNGVVETVSLACVPQAQVGDYVTVYGGFALDIINHDQVEETFQYLEKIENQPQSASIFA